MSSRPRKSPHNPKPVRHPFRGAGGGEPASTPSWASPPTVLRGCGPVIARQLEAQGLSTVEDLLYFMPREYQDRRFARPIDELVPGERATTCGVISQVTVKRHFRRRIIEVGISAEAGAPPALWCVWFRAFPSMAARFAKGKRVLASGPVRPKPEMAA